MLKQSTPNLQRTLGQACS
jgi:dynein heavy chain